MVVLFFVIIAAMRVIQKVCTKKVSNAVTGKTYFHYGGYYQLLSALFSLITLVIVGFYGFDFKTAACAFGTAVFMAIELFASIEALKGCTLIVSQMFSVGALFIPCLVGIFFFDEPMSVWQWVGLALFIVAMYFMVFPTKEKETKKKPKTSVKTFVMLLLTMLAGGGTMVMQKVFGRLVPDGNTAAYSFLMFAINALLLYACYFVQAFIKEKTPTGMNVTEKEPRFKVLPKMLLICGACLAFAVFMINMLVTELGKTVPSAILFSVSYAISIGITLIVGRFYYNEKITWKNIVGIVLCIGALAIINFL